MSADGNAGEPFVVISGRELDWGIRAGAVKQVVDARDWEGGVPADVVAYWGMADDGDAAARVLTVQSGGEDVGVCAGRLSFRTVASGTISPLPPLFGGLPSAPLIEGIAFPENAPPLVVLRAEALRLLFRTPAR